MKHTFSIVNYMLPRTRKALRVHKRVWCLVFLLGVMVQSPAQQSDFQFWPQVQIGCDLSDRFKLSLEEEVRFRENATQIKKELTDLGLTFKINKALRLGIKYRLEMTFSNPDEYTWRNGFYGDIMFRQKLDRFRFDYRCRFQSAKIETISEFSSINHWMTNRHKASLQYNIKGIPLFPEIEAEIFVPFRRQEALIINEYRLWAGITYAINKKHDISLKFGIQQEINVPDPWRAYILGLGYSLDIN